MVHDPPVGRIAAGHVLGCAVAPALLGVGVPVHAGPGDAARLGERAARRPRRRTRRGGIRGRGRTHRRVGRPGVTGAGGHGVGFFLGGAFISLTGTVRFCNSATRAPLPSRWLLRSLSGSDPAAVQYDLGSIRAMDRLPCRFVSRGSTQHPPRPGPRHAPVQVRGTKVNPSWASPRCAVRTPALPWTAASAPRSLASGLSNGEG